MEEVEVNEVFDGPALVEVDYCSAFWIQSTRITMHAMGSEFLNIYLELKSTNGNGFIFTYSAFENVDISNCELSWFILTNFASNVV